MNCPARSIALQQKSIFVAAQLQIIAQANWRNDHAHFLGESVAHAGNAFQQISALARIGKTDQP